MFRHICTILREFQSYTSQKRAVYIVLIFHLNYQIKIFMYLLLIKCSLYDFYNIICVTIMLRLPYIQLYFPVLMLPLCWGSEFVFITMANLSIKVENI